MAKTLFFYDLETSGFSPVEQRIMQFAGQRTDLDFKPIGEPYNYLIKMSEEILPEPDAILLTGITPQKTISEGITEAEFLKIFSKEISLPNTIFTGFNSVRFDDEFLRYLHYRNYYDPYEWQWKDGRGKWDLLDVVRMMRALRPDGITWPSDKGVPSNRLELLTKANNISHDGAHDALSDVRALIELAQLIKSKQPKLVEYLLDIMVDKNKIAKLVNDSKPFVYTSSKYPSKFQKTTVVAKIADHPRRAGALVYDLRYDPSEFANLSVDELISYWRPKDKDGPRLPVKTLQFNRCPAVAPLSVLDADSQERIALDLEQINTNAKLLSKVNAEFSRRILQALEILDKNQEEKYASLKQGVDGLLYDGFFDSRDQNLMKGVRSLDETSLEIEEFKFEDNRLNQLLPLYKARNYRKSLSSEEVVAWEKFRRERLLGGDDQSRTAMFFRKLDEFSARANLTKNDRYLLEELKLYAESILPVEI